MGDPLRLGMGEAVLEHIAVGVVVHDAELRVVYVNSAATALLGLTQSSAALLEAGRWLALHPDGTPVRPNEMPAAVALQTKQPVHGMLLGVQHREAETIWLTVDSVPVLDEAAAVASITVTLRDVGRDREAREQLERSHDVLRRQLRDIEAKLAHAEAALGASEARHRAVLGAMSEGVVVIDPEGALSFANAAAQEILGRSLAQLQTPGSVDPARHLTNSLGAPLRPEQVPAEITRLTGIPQRHTLLGVDSGSPGDRRWLSVSTDPISATGEGETKRYSVVATFADITAERSALAAAQVARDHLRDIAAALPGVVLEHWVGRDDNIEFRYVSAPVKEYFGVTPDEVIKDSNALWACVHPEDRETLLRQLRAPPEFTGVHLELRTVAADGKFRHLRWRSSAPTRIPEGTLFCSVVLDVTEQRRLEETVREAQRRDAIGTLAAGVAHNFNNMLAVIGPTLEFAKAQAPPLLLAELEDALTATRAATELVRQLMQLVRRDASDAAAAINVSKVAEEVTQLCRRTFDSGIDIQCSVPPVPCLVFGRRNELQQALVNLCINARDALANRPSPQLSLRVRAEGRDVIVEVSDNGAGMSPEVQRRMGEPFFTTKAPGLGTGLGLATVFGIVADLRGSMKCHSKLGQGTRFELTFPRYDAPSASVPHLQRVDANLPYTKVLLIDDEELVRNTLKRALSRANAEVLCAARPQEGLELLASNPDVGLVILDLAMPELSGSEVLRRIRLFNTTVPVYLMTGFLPEGIDVSQANGVLLKPVGLARIRELLIKHATT